MTNFQRKILEQNLAHYGIETQIDKLVEEAAEMIVELEKIKQNSDSSALDKLIDEIADVEVALWQVKYFFRIFVGVSSRVDYKVHRQLERMEKGARANDNHSVPDNESVTWNRCDTAS